jgi:4-diphosphocytidyl-2-C-methyl-D-erythritol kinase
LEKLLLKAPAKINYRLEVLRKRADGYHDLRMVMQRIDLSDEIEIVLRDSPGIDVFCDSETVSGGRENIAWRAADAILSLHGSRVGMDISITKKIPVAAGLGGGSSDAATVLMGLNEMLSLGFSDAKLMEIGVRLGADVPFFIFKKTALAEGIGEKLTPVQGLPQVWLVLVNPNLHVSTAWVYQNLTLTNRKDDYKLPRFCNRIEDICSILTNDLEAVTIGRFPVIKEIKSSLIALGAKGVLMSGSGPTVFAVFASEEEARCSQAKISEVDGWTSFLTRTL